MRVVLFRHAERESLGTSNPPLTRRGAAQAENLLLMVENKKLPNPTKLMVSPRLRSQMTFAPLSQKLQLDLAVRAELDERVSAENATQFASRVRNLLEKCEGMSGQVFLCTHLDWIEEALREIRSESDLLHPQYQAWAPGQFMTFQVESGQWLLEEFGVIS